ncbi:MAG: sigma-70 family RNA polymerase sigma factor [Planctomycetes bacterium]|nr:sigma-70 family RNA polymerase sigma factor [Planctomycetota bacterium]
MIVPFYTGEKISQPSDLAADELIEVYRPYSLAIANQELDSQIRPKVGASDIVQDSLLEAHLGSQDFRGRTLAEFKQWLRQILRHNLANVRKSYQQTEKRRLDREVSLDDRAQLSLKIDVSSEESVPLSKVIFREDLQQLQQVLHELPSEMRKIVVWHNLEQQSFPWIARELGCSEKSVQKKWVKAIRELRTRMARRLPS